LGRDYSHRVEENSEADKWSDPWLTSTAVVLRGSEFASPLVVLDNAASHPDHNIGLGVFRHRFPGVPVSVAAPESRDDIVGFPQRMASKEWLEAEPMMKSSVRQKSRRV